MRDIEQYLIFGHAALAGSFSRAAEQLGVSNSHISKHIAKLEQQLGYKLFHRSPHLQLTDSGKSLLPQVNALMANYEALSATAPGLKDQTSGLVRLSLPPLMAREAVMPKLAGFMREHSGLQLELNLQQSTLQAFSDNLDLVVTLGSLPDSSLICQRIGECQAILVATPEYLDRLGRPEHPEDLLQHTCLASHFPNFENQAPWQLSREGSTHRLYITTPIACNDIYAIKQLVMDHLGIGVMLKFFVDHELSQEILVPVLEGFQFAIQPPVFIVYHDRELVPKRVSVVKDFLIESIQSVL